MHSDVDLSDHVATLIWEIRYFDAAILTVPEDPESAEVEFKISKDINTMPEEVKDRFKALKVLTDRLHELDEEEDRAHRQIERKISEQETKLMSDAQKIEAKKADAAEAKKKSDEAVEKANADARVRERTAMEADKVKQQEKKMQAKQESDRIKAQQKDQANQLKAQQKQQKAQAHQ